MSESTPPPAPGQTDATATPSGFLRNFPEEWAKKKGTPLSSLYAAIGNAKWDRMALITEAEFESAVAKASDITINAIHGPTPGTR